MDLVPYKCESCRFTFGILCSHIHWGLLSDKVGCQEPDGDSSFGTGGRSWEEERLPTRLPPSPASTHCDGLIASLCVWQGENSISLRKFKKSQSALCPCFQSYLLRLSFLPRSRLDRSCRQQMRKDRDMAKMTMPLTTEANTATLSPWSSGRGIAVVRKIEQNIKS